MLIKEVLLRLKRDGDRTPGAAGYQRSHSIPYIHTSSVVLIVSDAELVVTIMRDDNNIRRYCNAGGDVGINSLLELDLCFRRRVVFCNEGNDFVNDLIRDIFYFIR